MDQNGLPGPDFPRQPLRNGTVEKGVVSCRIPVPGSSRPGGQRWQSSRASCVPAFAPAARAVYRHIEDWREPEQAVVVRCRRGAEFRLDGGQGSDWACVITITLHLDPD